LFSPKLVNHRFPGKIATPSLHLRCKFIVLGLLSRALGIWKELKPKKEPEPCDEKKKRKQKKNHKKKQKQKQKPVKFIIL
jgi:hypothetical protein